MATLTSQFFELLEDDKKEIFFKTFTMQELTYPKLFDIKKSVRAYEDGMRVAGFGTFIVKPEGAPIAFDDPVQGTRVRTTHTVYGLGWRATREMMEDDQFGIMSQMSSDLGESARDHQERLAWSLIDDGFTGNTYTGLEGETLFSDSHVNLKTGGTQSNILTPPVELGVTGLEAILTLAKTTTSDEGRFINLMPHLVVIPPNLMHQADVLLETEYEVDTNTSNISTVARSRTGLMPLVVPYLSSDTTWTVHQGPGKNGLTWNNRSALEFFSTGDPDTMDRKFYSSYRASVMTREWRGNWGSAA